MPYFLFEPDAPVAVPTRQPFAENHPYWTYMYVAGLGMDKWFIRDTKQVRWLEVQPEGVPETYRAQVLLLVAAYPD